MPTMNYRCTNSECNHLLEIFQGMSEEPLAFCPKCKDNTLEKIMQPTAFTHRGVGGWCGSKSQLGG